MAYCGRIIRAGGLQNLILLGKLNGKRGRGRPRKTWMEEVKRMGEMEDGSGGGEVRRKMTQIF